jgi:hypothetical protein
MAFREADGGRNGGISGGAAGVARERGRGELGGAELRWPLGAAGGFVEEKWRERGGGSRLGDGEERRGKKRGGGVRHGQRHAVEGGGGHGSQQGARPAEAGARQQRVSRGGEGGARGPCAKAWSSRGKEGAGPAREQQCRFLI